MGFSVRLAAKQNQAQELAQALDAILALHRRDFPPARKPVAPAPPPPDEAAIRARHEQAAAQEISVFRPPVGVDGDQASLVVLVPPPSAVPERRPAVTPSGNLSLKKLTKADRAAYYRLLVCGFVLATVREAFAVAPEVNELRIVALTSPGTDAYGTPRLDALLAARFARATLDGVRWDTVDAGTIVTDISTDLIVHVAGPSKELAPIDLLAEPGIAAVLGAADASELTS